MKNSEYLHLSNELKHISKHIPLKWGRVQNNSTDSKINMFEHNTYESLKSALSELDKETQEYFERRWFLWNCAQCDEYLFYKHSDINKNPNSRSQDWDFEFFGDRTLRFDLKGTVLPKEIREKRRNCNYSQNPMEIISFYYEKQSKGVRHHLQNRLFVVHIPCNWQTENILRANFKAKENIYDKYIEELRTKKNYNFFNYNGQKSDLLYIIEEEKNKTILHHFASKILNP